MEQQELDNIRKHIGKSAKRLEREDEDMPTMQGFSIHGTVSLSLISLGVLYSRRLDITAKNRESDSTNEPEHRCRYKVHSRAYLPLGTNINSASESTNRAISQGQATRST